MRRTSVTGPSTRTAACRRWVAEPFAQRGLADRAWSGSTPAGLKSDPDILDIVLDLRKGLAASHDVQNFVARDLSTPVGALARPPIEQREPVGDGESVMDVVGYEDDPEA